MRTCQESAIYLHNLKFRDVDLAEKYGVRREHINRIRNGKEKGSEELRAALHADCEKAMAASSGLKVQSHRVQQPAPKQPSQKKAVPIKLKAQSHRTQQKIQPAPKQPAQKGLLQVVTKAITSPPTYTMPPVQPRQSPPPRKAPPLPKYTPPIEPIRAAPTPYPNDWFFDDITPLEVTENQPTIQPKREESGWEYVYP